MKLAPCCNRQVSFSWEIKVAHLGEVKICTGTFQGGTKALTKDRQLPLLHAVVREVSDMYYHFATTLSFLVRFSSAQQLCVLRHTALSCL